MHDLRGFNALKTLIVENLKNILQFEVTINELPSKV